MKQVAIALMSLVLASSSSIAADMPVKARPAPVPVATWTGFYAGANVGYGWGDTSNTFNGVDPASQILFPLLNVGTNELNTAFRQRGAVAGGQLGYNWQFGTAGVMGIEADLQWADIKGAGYARSQNLFFDANSERRLQWFGTVRGRLGFLATPNLLLYGTGGLAYGQTQSSGDVALNPPGIQAAVAIQVPPLQFVCFNPPGARGVCYRGSGTENQVGWSAGMGGEWKINPNWSFKLEYLHVALSGTTATMPAAIPPSSPSVSTVYRYNDQNYDLVRIGVNYQFGGGTVVAKY